MGLPGLASGGNAGTNPISKIDRLIHLEFWEFMNPGFLPLLSWLRKLLWDFTYLCWNLTIIRRAKLMKIGYARVSTDDQNLDLQMDPMRVFLRLCKCTHYAQ
jgi:hypothetical protein